MTERSLLKIRLLRPGARMPWRATEAATGYDLFACLDLPGYLDIGPDETLVPTGIAVEAPRDFDVQVRPRSGVSRQGANVILGTLDADYRGELFVSMHTFGSLATYRVQNGDRIAQMVVSRVADIEMVEADALSDTGRAGGGHGSTGR